MIIINHPQGSAKWKAHRRLSRNASEAPIVMGKSKLVTYTKLLDMKKNGTEQEFGEWFEENVLMNGHRVEALARPITDAMIDDELFPATGTSDDGYLSASFDGITICRDTVWECKQWSEEKAAYIRETGKVPECDVWQTIQHLVVSGAERCLYTLTDGTETKRLDVWRTLGESERETLLAAWKQFDADLAAYVPREVIPEVIATPTMGLPAVSVQMQGSIAVISNLDVFGQKLAAFIDQIDMEPTDDQGFANAEAAVKTLQTAQAALEQAEAAALAQTSSIDDMRRTVALYVEQARKTRLLLEKMVKSRKDQLRVEIVREANDTFAAFIYALNQTIGKPYLSIAVPDFGGVIKGKKTLESCRNAVDTLMAQSKIAANDAAGKIIINLASLRELAADYSYLFADTSQIITKANDDLVALIKTRIAEHKEAEQKRLDAEREKIRAEEQAKAELESRLADAQKREDARQADMAGAEQHLRAAPIPVDNTPAVASVILSDPPGKPRIRQQTAPQVARPSNQDIINALATMYRVSPQTVIGWLSEMKLENAA